MKRVQVAKRVDRDTQKEISYHSIEDYQNDQYYESNTMKS